MSSTLARRSFAQRLKSAGWTKTSITNEGGGVYTNCWRPPKKGGAA